MNRLFVNVKVDREERPDVDSIYMDAVQAMTGRGGWPMTVFMTPDGRAVLRRHLLPQAAVPAADGRHRRRVAQPAGRHPAERRRAGRGDRTHQRGQAGRRRTRAPTLIEAGAAAAGRLVRRRVGRVRRGAEVPVDDEHRPRAARVRAHRATPTRAPSSTRRLGAMASGGMYDHLGGGFARYSVDRAVAGAPLREDAVRPGAADAGLRARRAGVRRPDLAAGRRPRRSTTCSATCATPTAASSRPRTPTRPTSTATGTRACSTRGRSTRCERVLGDDADAALDWYEFTHPANAAATSRAG